MTPRQINDIYVIGLIRMPFCVSFFIKFVLFDVIFFSVYFSYHIILIMWYGLLTSQKAQFLNLLSVNVP